MACHEKLAKFGLEARRFFFLYVSDVCRGEHGYFDALHAEMEAGGYAATLYDLLAYDLSGLNVRAVPVTSALQEQRALIPSGVDAWWMDVLHRGHVLQFADGSLSAQCEWTEEAATHALYRDHLDFAERRRE